MKKDTLNFLNNKEQIGELIAGKSYIIYFLSELKMGSNADLSLLIPEEEILEAHFFDQREYIHLFELDDKLQAAVFRDDLGEGLSWPRRATVQDRSRSCQGRPQ